MVGAIDTALKEITISYLKGDLGKTINKNKACVIGVQCKAILISWRIRKGIPEKMRFKLRFAKLFQCI